MYALKKRIVIPASRHIEIDLPDDVPEGEAEVIVLTRDQSARAKAVTSLRGLLATGTTVDGDPIADAIDELRRERTVKLDADSPKDSSE